MKLLLTLIFIGISIGSTAFAIEYTPIVDIPRINGNTFTTKEYIQALYFLAIAVAALIAVVKIIYGGVQYMLDGIVTHKEKAKKEIQGALFGLLIVLSAVLILNTINPHLGELNIFQNAPSLEEINASKVPPPPAAELGDKIYLNDTTPEEVTHFEDTCPGVINRVQDATRGTTLSCDANKDEVSSLALSCSGTKCTCDYGASANRGLCVAKCQTTPRVGFTYIGITDVSSSVLQCNYTQVVPPSSCSDIPFASCLTNMFETMCEITQPVCKRVDLNNNTMLYGFKE